MRDAFGVEANLIPGSGGIFEVTVDGRVVFNKAETDRFPGPGEVVGLLKSVG